MGFARVRSTALPLVAVVWVLTCCLPTNGQDITTNLRGFWKLDDTSGSTALDSSGQGAHGTYTGTMQKGKTGRVKYAVGFSDNGGTTDRVSLPYTVLNNQLNVTLSFWIRTTSTSYHAILSANNSSNDNEFFVFIESGQLKIRYHNVSNGNVWNLGTIYDGNWHHIVVIANHSSNNTTVYKDGSSLGTQALDPGSSFTVSSGGLFLAQDQDCVGGCFDSAQRLIGDLDQVRIYDRVLGSTDIAYLYRDGKSVAHWKLNETSGSSAADSSGLGNTGTVTGTSSWTSAVRNNGFSFNGSTKIQASGLMGKSRDVSVAAWANLTAADSGGAEVISLGDHVLLRLDEAGYTNAFIYDGSSWAQVSVNQTFAGTGWHHFAAVFDDDNDSFKLYIDGVQAASASTASSISYSGLGGNTVIGRHGNGETTRDFTGVIDDVRVYVHALTDDEVAELHGFIGHWRLTETSGTTAADATIFAQNGTVTGGANWSSNCGGDGVFDFDGSSHYISIPNASHLQPTEALTIVGWVKGDSWNSGGEVNIILRKGEGNPNNYQLAIADGQLSLYLDENDSGGTRSVATLSTGRWYHVAATWDGTTVKVFLDGQLDNSASRSGTIATDTRPLYIGGRSGNDFFDGMIRDVRIYNRALLAAEIASLAGAAGHWEFLEGTGTVAVDSSGAGNDATLTGGASWTTNCLGENALQTDGAGGIAQTVANFTPPDQGTVAFWMRSSGTPLARSRIFGVGGDWEMRQETDGTISIDLCGDASTDFVTTVPVDESGTWYHIAATYNVDDDTYAVYINGQLDNSGVHLTGLSTQAADVLSFGTRTGSTEYWQGALRDFRVYSRRLCPAEIAKLYGLVGHWKLDEGAGSSAADSSGMGNHGTLSGNWTWLTSGKVDGSLDFETTDGIDRIDVPAFDLIGTGVTLAAWIRPENAFNDGRIVIKSIGNDTFDQYWGLTCDAATRVDFRINAGGTFVLLETSDGAVTPGQWQHVAGTYDGTTMRLYVDGLESTSTVHSVGGAVDTSESATITIGDSPVGSRTYDGVIDDVRVYNRPLCPAEIAELFSNGAPTGVRIIKWVEIQ